MKYKIEATRQNCSEGVRELVLTWADVHVIPEEGTPPVVKSLKLEVMAGDIVMVEIEEYIADGIVTTAKSRHTVKSFEIETIEEEF